MAITAQSVFDNKFPAFEKEDSAEKKIQKVSDYLYVLVEEFRYVFNHLDERNFSDGSFKKITDPIYADIKNTKDGLETIIEALPGQIMTQVSANFVDNETAAQAAAQIKAEAKTYTDGAVSTLSQSVAATYQPISGMSAYQTITAAASQLAEAKAYADGAVSTLSQSVAANYLANSARAGIVTEATAAATGAVAQMVLYVEDGNGRSSISINGGTIALKTNITEVNGTLHIGGSGYRGNGIINLNRWSYITADSNEDLEVCAGSTLYLNAYYTVELSGGDGDLKIYAGSAGRYWYFDGTGIYWCNSDGSVRKSVVLE